MPARKTVDSSASLEAAEVKTNPAEPGNAIRKLEDVAPEIRKLREAGFNHEEITQKLQVSYDVINQLFLQSYKMTMNTFEVFEAQEKIRLGL